MTAPDGPELVLAGFVLLVLVALVVVRPLLSTQEPPEEDEERASLEAAKEAKYREIRDAELDRRMGKLSEEDFRTTDRELRAQAIEILKRIDALEGRRPKAGRSEAHGGNHPPAAGRGPAGEGADDPPAAGR